MRRAQIFTAVILLMSVSACGSADPEPTAAAPSPSAVLSIAPVASAAAEAGLTCKLAAAAPKTGEAIEIDEDMIKAIIANAGKSGVVGLEKAGAQVQARYTAWLGAAIGDEAAKAQDDLLDAVGQVRTACGA